MKNNKGYLLVVLAAMVFLTLVSCGGNESSSDSVVSETLESSAIELSAYSSVSSYDDSDVSAEPSSEDAVSEMSSDSSEESSVESAGEQSQESSVDTSAEISGDNSKESSEETSKDNSKDNSKESSEETSKDTSKDNSKESSEETSKETSKDNSKESSEDISEDSSGEIADGIPEKYHNLESVKAIFALEDKYPDYIHVFMKSEMMYMGYPANIIIETHEDKKGGKSVSNFRLEALGTTLMSKTGINTGKKCYMMDDVAKTYSEVSEKDLETFAWDKLFANVSSVETKNEVVGNESFVADWFTNKDGVKCGLYTKDGSLEYMFVIQKSGESTKEMFFEITVNEEKWDGDYKIPSGYIKK